MIQPFEVSYTSSGRKGLKNRDVIGVLCPTVLDQMLWDIQPIFISLGDVYADWKQPTTAGFDFLFSKYY